MEQATRIDRMLRDAAQYIGAQEARWLMQEVCAMTHAQLLAASDAVLSVEQREYFVHLLARRRAGEPLAYLLGEAPFADAVFKVSPAVLIPRPETELLVSLAQAALFTLKEHCAQPQVLELGTGSGVIAITLAKRCAQAQIIATDLSAEALALAQSNAELHGQSVCFRQGDWFEALVTAERFHLIVSNPPYIAAEDSHLLRDGLPYEPRQALTDDRPGALGLYCLQQIIEKAPSFMHHRGQILLEHGYDQAPAVRQLLKKAGFRSVQSWHDEARIERVSGGVWLSGE